MKSKAKPSARICPEESIISAPVKNAETTTKIMAGRRLLSAGTEEALKRKISAIIKAMAYIATMSLRADKARPGPGKDRLYIRMKVPVATDAAKVLWQKSDIHINIRPERIPKTGADKLAPFIAARLSSKDRAPPVFPTERIRYFPIPATIAKAKASRTFFKDIVAG